ncbi:MAG: hypothetical protein Q8L87_06055 [Anaerolineales bacterium]|jgi:hypothetical protein|nr:hypothetical protein [Anaerolineales bacterium]
MEFPDIDLVIHDLVDGNAKYIDDYLAIYQELFPQYVRYTPVMRQRAEVRVDQSANEKWHQWLLVMQGKPVGIVGFLYNRKRNIGLLMDFAIYPDSRNTRINGRITFSNFALNLSMRQLIEDARENGHESPICMAAEVEYPALVRKYIQYGYVKFPVEYLEPPYTPELEKVGDKILEVDNPADYERMFVGAFHIPGYPFDPVAPEIVKTVLLAFLEDHYHLPMDHWLIQKVIQEIPV